MPEHSFTVDVSDENKRVDIYLTSQLPEHLSRMVVKRLIEQGAVTLNQKPVKPHQKLHDGDVLHVTVEEPRETSSEILPEEIPLDVFYEDQSLAVINKPAGLLVHPVQGTHSGTLVNAILHRFSQLSNVDPGGLRPGIVHRLDRETSGLILIAKDNQTHVRLSRDFQKHRIMKKYIALVQGHVEFDEGVIEAALGRHPRHFEKKSVSDSEEAKDAITYYKTLKRFSNRTSMMALYPKSGRTHQLRVHMAHLGHSILGDDKYGKQSSFFRLALHAQSIGFKHPHSKRWVEFSCAVPAEFFTSGKSKL